MAHGDITVDHIGIGIIRVALLSHRALTLAFAEGPHRTLASLTALERSAFLEAVTLSIRGIADPETLGAESSTRSDAMLLRYLIRSAARPTPQGLFATFGWGRIAPVSTVLLKPLATLARRTRPDAAIVRSWLRQELGADIDLVVEFNPLARRIGARWHLELVSDNPVPPIVECFAHSPELDIVRRAAARPLAVTTLIGMLAREHPDVDNWQEYVSTLVAHGLLRVPPLDGLPSASPFEALEQIRATFPSTTLAETASRLEAECRVLDARGPGRAAAEYAALRGALGRAAHEVPLSRLVQVDAYRDTAEGIAASSRLAESACSAVAKLWHVTPNPDRRLSRFAAAFEKRYGESFVPLLDALDAERGLAWALRDTQVRIVSSPHRDSFLRERVAGHQSNRAFSWSLSTRDLEALRLQRPPAPERMVALVLPHRAADQEDAPVRGLLERAFGTSTTALFARFLSEQPELLAHVRQWQLNSETEATGFSADILFVPHARLGNVLAHPPISTRAISVDTSERGHYDHVYTLQDLVLTLRNDKFELWSQSRAERLRPMLRNAHTFDSDLVPPAYRFLATLALEDNGHFAGWHWGDAVATHAFHPRVVLDDLVVSRARWRTPRALDAESIHQWIRGIRESSGVRWLRAGQHDRWRPYDLESSRATSLLVDEIVKHRIPEVTELFPEPDDFGFASDTGLHNGELVLPLAVSSVRHRHPPSAPPSLAPWVGATGRPSRQWVSQYVRCGTSLQDEIIVSASESTSRPEFFVVRYHDPAPHLRLRVLTAGHGQWHRGAVYGWIQEVLRSVAGEVEFDCEEIPYRPEQWRYGGPNLVPLAEDVFTAESAAIGRVLARMGIDGDESPRTHAILELHAEALVGWLGSAEAIRAFLSPVVVRDHRARRAAHDASRDLRSAAHSALVRSLGGERANQARHAAIVRYRHATQRSAERGLLSSTSDAILHSLLHMTANRIYRLAPVPTERFVLALLYGACQRIAHESGATNKRAPR